MSQTSREKQRRLRSRLYEAGLKPVQVWVKRKEPPRATKLGQKEFVEALNKLTEGWDADSLSQLYSLFLKIVEGKKAVARKKGK